MKKPENLKLYKTELRNEMKRLRMSIPEDKKQLWDAGIAKQLFGMSIMRDATTVLVYVSKELEVDTIAIIEKLWEQGKKVAVPRCVDNKREMEFYYLHSFDELTLSGYGILEPAPIKENLAVWDENTLCLVPATCCDKKGYRLGYGGGYYDRFLSAFPGIKAVILYSSFVVDKIWHGKFDVSVDFIVTEVDIYDVRAN